MKHRTLAAVAAVMAGVSTSAFACPGILVCVPSACLEMHRNEVRQQTDFSNLRGGPSVAASLNMTLLAQVPLSAMGGTSTTDGSSLYGWTDPVTNREYAIMGRSNGTAFIDITNPAQPKYVANLPNAASSNTSWREPKVVGNHAYIGVDGTNHPIQVVDLTKLRQFNGTTPLQLTADVNYRGAANTLTRAHTLAVNHDTGFIYAAGTNLSSGGLHIIDARNPGAPFQAGGFSLDGYTHETQVVLYKGPDPDYRGREIAFNSNGKQGTTIDTFSIVDVTNKTTPSRISSKTYANARYIHQGWLTEDHRYFFQNDELDETGGVTGGRTRTHLWDVSDLDNPVYKGYLDQETTSIDHNLYVKNGYVFQTNYTTGLRVFKIGDLASDEPTDWLSEVAFYDTFPSNDGRTFNGAWNNYPFFASGNVVVSDIDGGLFILRPDLPGWGPTKGNFQPRPIFDQQMGLLVPEPGSIGMVGAAGVLMSLRRRRRA